MAHHNNTSSSPFLFPKAHSRVMLDPVFFSPQLQSSPLPTNSFFQNFTLKAGDQPEYIHPYLVKSSNSSISLCYPSLFHNSSLAYQTFVRDITISATDRKTPFGHRNHEISSFSDLGVTLDMPSANFRFFLVRGSPFLTCSVTGNTPITISTIHGISSFTGNASRTKCTLRLKNNQTWLIYSSAPIHWTNPTNPSFPSVNWLISTLTNTSYLLSSGGYSGIIRIALLPDSNPKYEAILDRFSSCYPVSGDAAFTKPFSVEYKWEKKGKGDLLMLAHPLHVKLLSRNECDVSVLDNFKYRSIDGDLVGIIGDSWVLKSNPIQVTWHSINGVKQDAFGDIISALVKDVESLDASAIKTNCSYFFGKLIARAARMALIAEEVGYPDVIPTIGKFLKDTIEPWLDGAFSGNGFLYDDKWGGMVTKQGSTNSGANFGFGVYNDHHYHIGYFVYGIAVLAKIDPAWGRNYRERAYSLLEDIMNVDKRSNSNYTVLRCFDLYKLHSWAGGLCEFRDGRNQESTSEAVNAYYSAALMGLAYGDNHLAAVGSSLTALEIQAAQMWWHVKESDDLYPKDFSRNNRIVGVLWSNKRDSGLWFARSDWRECRLGIQLLPLLPISEVLFSDVGFVRELVEWTLPALGRAGVEEGWKGFAYALQAVYDKETALKNVKKLRHHDDGNSLTNLLWWIHSRA